MASATREPKWARISSAWMAPGRTRIGSIPPVRLASRNSSVEVVTRRLTLPRIPLPAEPTMFRPPPLMSCLVCPLPALAPRPEALGPVRTDSGPCRLPGGEPAPVKYPPPGPRQVQQHDPQRRGGNDRRGGLVGHYQAVVRRRTGRRAGRVYPQRDGAASGQAGANRDPAGP